MSTKERPRARLRREAREAERAAKRAKRAALSQPRPSKVVPPVRRRTVDPNASEEEKDLVLLRRLAGGSATVAKRDAERAQRLAMAGLIEVARTTSSRTAWDLTRAGVDALLATDGPMTADERAEWLSWPKTRFGKDGDPQKLLQGPKGPIWRTFHVPRARALMETWRRHGIRSSSW